MTPNYFARLRTEASITKRYRELAKIHHPDRGGDHEAMTELNRQYEIALRAVTTRSSAPRSPESTQSSSRREKPLTHETEGAEEDPDEDETPIEFQRASEVVRGKLADAAVSIFDTLLDAGTEYLKRKAREKMGTQS